MPETLRSLDWTLLASMGPLIIGALLIAGSSGRVAQRVPGISARQERSSSGGEQFWPRDLGEGDCSVSRDLRQIEREIAQAARWVVKWRMLQNEALEVAGAMRDPEARRHMLFIAEAYKLLAERSKERSERLAKHASHMKAASDSEKKNEPDSLR